MRLSKIKLAGFKTFVDPTTITFPSNLMGIVGPNGCGKSNIIDGIRWVLGESSAKTLRGEQMADVIFNGSSARKPVGQASIELVFDNSDGKIGGQYAGYAEISVKRTVSRDGTSQYYLNNVRCRRKDVTHLLLGTGLGSHGYSIIEQGMISRLVEAKPEELRAFLEEAAGISKYKERRKETEHRIRHTRENLERLRDLREEIEKQLTHLQRQAQDAERYKELSAQKRRVNAELLALRLKAHRAEVEQHERAFGEKQVTLEAALAEQRSIEAAIEKLREALAEKNEAFNEVQGTYYRTGSEIARLEQSIQHRKELLQRQREELEATNQQLEELEQLIANDRVELQQIDEMLRELTPSLEEAYEKLRAAQQELESAEAEMESWRERWERVSEELAATERASHVEATRLEQLTAQHERLAKEQQRQAEERAALSFADLEQRLEVLIGEEERLGAECEESARSLATFTREIQQLRELESTVSRELDELRERLTNDRGTLASLQALQEVALGHSDEEVNGWLAARDLAARARLAQELVVDPGWERAVETVLGPYLQAVDVDSLDALANELPSLPSGGITLLESGGDGGADGASGWSRSSGVAYLADHVKAPVAALRLLAGIRTAATLEDALAMRRTLPEGESVVTPDGYWLGANWLRIARTDDPQAGVLLRGEEIKRLRAAVDDTARRVEEAAQALASARTRLDELEQSRTAAQAEAARRQEHHAEVKQKLAATRHELEQARARAAALDGSLAELAAEHDTLTAALNEARLRHSEAAERQRELQLAREELERERVRHQERVAAARAEAERHREAAQAMAIKVESRRSSKESASAALQRVQAQQEQLLKRRHELERQAEITAEPLAGEEQALAARLDERMAVEQALAAARAATEEVDAQLREAEHKRHAAQQAVAEVREAAEQVRLTVREAQVRAETVAEQFAETGFELDTVMSELPENANVAEWHESLEKLERRIQRLGNINLAAIDEFKEQSERKLYLDSQYKDLTEALETLEAAIRKIDRETRARFKETFDKANAGLGRLFPRLFGGGHAYLEMNGEDLLEAGVTIMARPPGKKNSSIHLLSGGEKALTAVALVFSIFELNPAPFCLLDEVDAPLDDANVGRFAEIVREMSAQVQFVIITHNKTTMEAMHQLTGVTMNEPGVSRMVAVDIDEAVKLAAM